MTFTTAIEAAITEDDNRKTFSLQQWRAYFLEEVEEIPKGTRVTPTGILNSLGPIAGATLVKAVEKANEVVGKLLSPSEGGLDITHSDSQVFFTALVNGGLATQAQIDTILNSYRQKQKRHSYLGLPDPRERAIKQALSEINS